MSCLDEIAVLFAREGARDYLGELVTQSEHMLQAGLLAQHDGASDALVAATLLHDIGHLRREGSGLELMAGTDNSHAKTGAEWLTTWFGPDVTEPVRLHVAAKRYLCHVDAAYFSRLSEASRYTLSIQGGLMNEVEAEAFEGEDYFEDALALRRWDEAAKDPAAPTPELGEFRDLLERLNRLSGRS
jgi:gamma-butyrobetaine dioxygenase